MKTVSRLGSGRVAGWFNGWWVVGVALLVGVGGPLVMTLRSSKSADAPARRATPTGLFDTVGVDVRRVHGQAASDDERLVRDNSLSQRMQMTIALATSASLRLARARVEQGIPVDTGALYAGMVKETVNGKPLMPRGFAGPQSGSNDEAVILSSNDGLYLLRYSAELGMVEVISVAREAGTGQPAMLARLPDDKAIFGDQIGFYTRFEVDVSMPGSKGGLEGVLVPAFGDSARMVGAGWRIVKLSMPRAALDGGAQ